MNDSLRDRVIAACSARPRSVEDHPFSTGEVAGPGRQSGDQVDGLKPTPVIVDSLPLERSVVDYALHDEFAARARGEQPEQLAHPRPCGWRRR